MSGEGRAWAAAVVICTSIAACQMPVRTDSERAVQSAAGRVELRIGSLAPPSSPWANVLADYANEVARMTNGRVRVSYVFPNDVESEMEMLSRMQRGELEGASISSTAVDALRPDLRVFELPLLFESDGDAAAARTALKADVRARLDAAGLVLLTLNAAGRSYLFSRSDPRTEMATTTWWVWERDASVAAILRQAGYGVDQRDVPAVQQGLASGDLGGCYAPLPVAHSLDWQEHIRYVAEPPLGHGIAMMVVSKKAFALVSSTDQEAVQRAAVKTTKRMDALLAAAETKTRAAFEKAGIQFVHVPADRLSSLRDAAKDVWNEHASSPEAKDLLDKLLRTR